MTNEEKISDIKHRIELLKGSLVKPKAALPVGKITPFSIVIELFSGIAVLGFLAVWVLLMWAFGAVLKTIYLNMHNNQAAETEVV